MAAQHMEPRLVRFFDWDFCRRCFVAFIAFLAQPDMDMAGTSTRTAYESLDYVIIVCRYFCASRVRAPYGRGRSASAQTWQGKEKLLDHPDPAWAASIKHVPPILRVCFTMLSFVSELWMFLRERKKLWLLPIILLMAIFGALIVLTQGSALAPFIYTIF